MANADSLYELAKGSVQALIREVEDLGDTFQVHPDSRLSLERYLTTTVVTGIQLFLTGENSGMYRGAKIAQDAILGGRGGGWLF